MTEKKEGQVPVFAKSGCKKRFCHHHWLFVPGFNIGTISRS